MCIVLGSNSEFMVCLLLLVRAQMRSSLNHKEWRLETCYLMESLLYVHQYYPEVELHIHSLLHIQHSHAPQPLLYIRS